MLWAGDSYQAQLWQLSSPICAPRLLDEKNLVILDLVANIVGVGTRAVGCTSILSDMPQ